MAEYISREVIISKISDSETPENDRMEVGYNLALDYIKDYLEDIPSADVQPLSVIAKHIKKRLYETAFNTTEAEARDAIAAMAERIDFWIDELKEGDTK